MENFTLKFGKHKGVDFLSTPKSYQNWLLKQDWFKIPSELKIIPLHRQSLSGWGGHGGKGEVIYDAIFEQECIDQDLTNDELYQKYN